MTTRTILRGITIAVLVLATYVADRATGLTPDFTALYLVPVVLASYWFGLGAGLGVAVTALVVEVLAHLALHGPMVVVNAVTHLAVFAFVAVVTWRLQAQLREIRALQERRDYEIEIARHVQESVADFNRPTDPRFDVETRMRAARELGGDFLLVRRTERGLFACIADISGKGISAALFTALLQASLSAALEVSDEPGTVVRTVNARMYKSLPNEMFVTMFCCLMLESELRYCNSGHEPGLLVANDETHARELLSEGGLPVGIQPDLCIPTTHVSFAPGDTLLCVTDGVTDSPAFAGDHSRLGHLFEQEADGDAASLADSIFRLATRDEGTQRDDVTVLVMKRREGERA